MTGSEATRRSAAESAASATARAPDAAEPAAPTSAAVEAAATLRDPARRALYRLISDSDEPVGRDEAAEATGLRRSTAAFHLDRLAEVGLLEVEFRRRSGKEGPGAGRPAKLYRRAERAVELSVPERRYELAGQVLAGAVERSESGGRPIREAIAEIAHETGVRAAAGQRDLLTVLTANGYEPRADADGDVVFGNCPFHSLTDEHRPLVCTMNLHLVQGMADGCACGAGIEQDPSAGRCCIRAVGLADRSE